jgi:hypothetical protein
MVNLDDDESVERFALPPMNFGALSEEFVKMLVLSGSTRYATAGIEWRDDGDDRVGDRI